MLRNSFNSSFSKSNPKPQLNHSSSSNRSFSRGRTSQEKTRNEVRRNSPLDSLIKMNQFKSEWKGLIPEEKETLVDSANDKVKEVMENYNLGLITNNERYNQIIDIWTHTNSKLTNILMNQLINDKQGFNSIYMMFDSGARGSKEQIRQLSGMRGLMAKPQKSGATSQEIIENPILSNFKEGLSILEYFISTHGARKGLADTALKTADAGYLTRRLVDVSQDVIIKEHDCGTLRGLVESALKKNEDIIESLHDRILGRTYVHDVYHPETDELLANSGAMRLPKPVRGSIWVPPFLLDSQPFVPRGRL